MVPHRKQRAHFPQLTAHRLMCTGIYGQELRTGPPRQNQRTAPAAASGVCSTQRART
jgi:hypothetical protein